MVFQSDQYGARQGPFFPVRRLPKALLNYENFEWLTGASHVFSVRSGAAACIERALAEYARRVDLLALCNRASGWEHFPGLTIILGRLADGSAGYQLTIDEKHHAEHVGPWLNLGGESICGQAFDYVAVPLGPLLTGAARLSGTHTVYVHTFGVRSLVGDIALGKKYIGQTCQGWGKRWGQHRGAANSGSRYLFHQAIRDVGLWKHRLHQVIGFNLPFDNAMEIEEAFVAAGTLHPAGLNMIPGGFAGIRYLAAHNYSCDRKKWEHRDQVLKQFADYCERDGRPNPLVAMLWRDPNYASSVICGNPRNLDRRQVGHIRSLESGGWTPDRIAAEMGIKADRVRRLLTGRTYAMVR